MPRGGARIGAGRPPKDDRERWLDGNAGKRGPKVAKVLQMPPIEPVNPAPGLTERETAIWNELEPFALKARTLVPATRGDFAVLCQLEVEYADVLKERRAEGWTPRGIFLAKEVRGLLQRLEGKRRAFRLAPMGKEMVEPETPKDPFSEFDDAGMVQ